jgi:hypothetical protein
VVPSVRTAVARWPARRSFRAVRRTPPHVEDGVCGSRREGSVGVRRKERLLVPGPKDSGIPVALIIALIIAVALMLFIGLRGPSSVRF